MKNINLCIIGNEMTMDETSASCMFFFFGSPVAAEMSVSVPNSESLIFSNTEPRYKKF